MYIIIRAKPICLCCVVLLLGSESCIITKADHSDCKIINKSTQNGKQQPFTPKHKELWVSITYSPVINVVCWRGEERWCGPLCLWMIDWLMTKTITMATAHLLILLLDKNIDFSHLMLSAMCTSYADCLRRLFSILYRKSINNFMIHSNTTSITKRQEI